MLHQRNDQVGSGHFGRRNCNIVKYTRSPGVQCSVSPVLFVMFMSMNLDFCLFLDDDICNLQSSKKKCVLFLNLCTLCWHILAAHISAIFGSAGRQRVDWQTAQLDCSNVKSRQYSLCYSCQQYNAVSFYFKAKNNHCQRASRDKSARCVAGNIDP